MHCRKMSTLFWPSHKIFCENLLVVCVGLLGFLPNDFGMDLYTLRTEKSSDVAYLAGEKRQILCNGFI